MTYLFQLSIPARASLLTLALFCSSYVLACTCSPELYLAGLVRGNDTEYIVRGTVVDYGNSYRNPDNPQWLIPTLRFAVAEYILGEPQIADTLIIQGQDGVNCGAWFPLDFTGEGLLYLNYIEDTPMYNEDGVQWTHPTSFLSFCGPTALNVIDEVAYGPICPGMDSIILDTLRNGLDKLIEFNSQEDIWLPIGSEWLFGTRDADANIYPTRMEITGDTVINGRYYYELYRDELSCDNAATYSYIYKENKQIYQYSPSEDELHLLYDLNAEEGDTVAIPLWNPGIANSGVVPDTLFYTLLDRFINFGFGGAETYTIHYGARNSDGNIIFGNSSVYRAEVIGNIGSTRSFFHTITNDMCEFPKIKGLRCFSYPGSLPLTYDNTAPGCTLVSVDDLPTEYIKVYPNPVTDILTIETPDFPAFELSLQDLNGRSVIQHKVIANQVKMEINVSDLSPGIYFLSLVADGKQTTRRIVIQ